MASDYDPQPEHTGIFKSMQDAILAAVEAQIKKGTWEENDVIVISRLRDGRVVIENEDRDNVVILKLIAELNQN